MILDSHIRLHRKFVYLVIGGVLLTLLPFSCKKQTAQYPSNKAKQQDSTEMSLRDYNQELIQKEDSAILVWISSQSADFKKSKSGIWHQIQTDTLKPFLVNDSSCMIDYSALSIGGELVFQEESKTVRFGKKEVPTGLEEGLRLMRKGDDSRFIVPSYLAYGAMGTDIIPPYTPIIYIVKSK